MIDKFMKFFEMANADDVKSDPQVTIKKASAALLLEVARADLDFSNEELTKINALLHDDFGLSNAEVQTLLELLDSEHVSMHPFTSLINDKYDYEKKVKLMQQLWSVAFADGELSGYEDAAIRKIADLLYIRHSDFIRTKHAES
ncbi:MAG: TerB family tellurite resistance protein [Pseudomonadota bacterium]